MQTQIVPYFFVIGMRLETHEVYSMGKINLACCNLLISDLMAMALAGCIRCCFCQMGGALGHIFMWCSMIVGSRLGI